jgi:hypothetical protein
MSVEYQTARPILFSDLRSRYANSRAEVEDPRVFIAALKELGQGRLLLLLCSFTNNPVRPLPSMSMR